MVGLRRRQAYPKMLTKPTSMRAMVDGSGTAAGESNVFPAAAALPKTEVAFVPRVKADRSGSPAMEAKIKVPEVMYDLRSRSPDDCLAAVHAGLPV
jgi:hypothetical protein